MAETTPAEAKKARDGNGKAKAAPRRSAASKANEALARAYFEAVAARDAKAMAGHWAEDGVLDIAPLGVFRGPSGVEQNFSEVFAAFPDMEMIVERVISDAETAVVQWRLTGTFSGAPFQGVEPTGREVALRGTDLLDIEDGKIKRNTAFYDGAEFARGIGLLPPQDSGAERAMRSAFNVVTKVRRSVGERS